MIRNCDGCGQFLPWILKPGSSSLFVPDTPFTYEEDIIYCPTCTNKYGTPVSRQHVDTSQTSFVVT